MNNISHDPNVPCIQLFAHQIHNISVSGRFPDGAIAVVLSKPEARLLMALVQNPHDGESDDVVKFQERLFNGLNKVLSRRYLCERCGGTGLQKAGYWDGKAYAGPAGKCDHCNGEGVLGYV